MADMRTQMAGGAVAEAREELRRIGVHPAAEAREPHRRGIVIERHHRPQPARAAALDDVAVMIEHGDREEARLGLDPRPF